VLARAAAGAWQQGMAQPLPVAGDAWRCAVHGISRPVLSSFALII